MIKPFEIEKRLVSCVLFFYSTKCKEHSSIYCIRRKPLLFGFVPDAQPLQPPAGVSLLGMAVAYREEVPPLVPYSGYESFHAAVHNQMLNAQSLNALPLCRVQPSGSPEGIGTLDGIQV